ncbi:MAG: hypothetical protein MZV70_36115 [Desulfobacterales bacterium]|nr:hypothetical protein [Desulfobacterales bacterium]
MIRHDEMKITSLPLKAGVDGDIPVQQRRYRERGQDGELRALQGRQPHPEAELLGLAGGGHGFRRRCLRILDLLHPGRDVLRTRRARIGDQPRKVGAGAWGQIRVRVWGHADHDRRSRDPHRGPGEDLHRERGGQSHDPPRQRGL